MQTRKWVKLAHRIQVIQSRHKRTTNAINQYDQIQMEMRHLYLCLHLQSFIDRRHLSCVQSSVKHALMFYLQNQLFKNCWSVFQSNPLPEKAGSLGPGREWAVAQAENECKAQAQMTIPCDASMWWRWAFETYQDRDQKTRLPDNRWMDGVCVFLWDGVF